MKNLNLLYGPIIASICSGCVFILGPTQKVVHDYDPYRKKETLKLRQSYVGRTDLRGSHIVSAAYYNLDLTNDSSATWVVVSLSTSIRDTDFEPEMYLHTDNDIFECSSEHYTTKLFLKSSSSSTTSSSTETEKVEGEKKNEGAEKTKTTETTTTQTTSATDMYQFMSRRFLLDDRALDQMRTSQRLQFRLYLGYEAVDVRVKRKERNRLKKFSTIATGHASSKQAFKAP